MSLFKQIILIFITILFFVLSIVMYQNFKTSNDFVQNQLYKSAQDTATSLGLSLSSVVDGDDISTMQTMMNAIYDRGYYQEITLIDTEDKALYQLKKDVAVKGVPVWFINLINLKTPPAKALINSGWYPFGTIKVVNHPGLAYVQLYNTLKSIVIYFSILAVIIIILLSMLLIDQKSY